MPETKFKALVNVTGAAGGKSRPGADIVTVIDVSGSMGKGTGRLEKLKTAMLFVIRKLSSIDRLSIVTFSSTAHQLCPLRLITKESQQELEDMVKALKPGGNTNINDGLQIALKVIRERRYTSDRTCGIMLMSDGVENIGSAAEVQAKDVPVFTFGFTKDHDNTVLQTVANNSKGGTYALADVDNTQKSSLSKAFSICLAGLLTVAVEDVIVTITPENTKINDDTNTIMPKIVKVSAGSYVTTPNADGSYTVSLGNLYIKETRKILVTLLLPPVTQNITMNGLKVAYSFVNDTKTRVPGRPDTFKINRVGSSTEPENEEVIAEEKRLETAEKMKEARILADQNKMDEANDTLVDAECLLDDVLNDNPHPMIKIMKSDVQQLKKYMTPDLYKTLGRAFALASETCHDRQRCAAKGGDEEKGLLFATPRMKAYVEQAKSFEQNPDKPLPTIDEDIKQEDAADPFASIAGPLALYLDMAIQSLQSIKELLGANLV